VRASDADRERVLRHLREAAAEGRLAHDSFVRRVDLTLRAKDQGALAAVTADLPERRTGRALAALRARLHESRGRIGGGAAKTRSTPLRLPPRQQLDYSIGRSPGCDLVVSDPTVSRVHAVLRCFGDQWFLVDLGSTNGSRVNGFRTRGAVAVGPGDLVTLGRAAFRVQTAPRQWLSRRGRPR
jgi:hypothetical protein